MIAKQVFWGLVAVTTILFLILFVASGTYVLAALAAALGGMWFAADAKIASQVGTVFFLAFLALAVLANLFGGSTFLALLGLCADLAAWDVARLRVRLDGQFTGDTRAIVEARHLRLLAVIVCAGFLMALLPVFVHLAIPFVIVFVVALLALVALRQSMRNLRAEHDPRQKKAVPKK